MNHDERVAALLDDLQRLHPGRLSLKLDEVAKLSGLSVKTLYNTRMSGQDIFPSVKIGGKLVVLIRDVAHILAGGGQTAACSVDTVKRRGRPRKNAHAGGVQR